MLQVLNPLNKKGIFFLPHLLVIGAVFLLGFGLGWWGHGVVYDRGYFRAHYQAPESVPSYRVTAPAGRLTKVPSAAYIPLLGYYPAVGDQGSLGSCAGWESTWVASYLWRVSHPGSWLRFSPRQAYDHYSDTYNNGQDGGSFPDQDLEMSNTTGLMQFKYLPYPPQVIDDPLVLSSAQTYNASRHRFPLVFVGLTPYGQYQGAGFHQAVIQALANGHPVNLSIQVYPEFDNATQTGGMITGPLAGEGSRGGHEIAAIGYDSGKRFSNGDVGGVLIQNQWSTNWGLSGRAWISYAGLDAMSFYAEYEVISTTREHTFPPPRRVSAPHLGPRAGQALVHNVRTLDTGVDISQAINNAAVRYGFSAVGYVALMGTESDLHQYAPHYPIAGAGSCDYSAGLVQITVCTAGSYPLYVGDGSESQSNINYIFWYEQQDPAREASLGGELLSYFKSLACWDFPTLYSAWNQGPGWGCYSSVYQYPSDPIAQRANANYAGWWDYAWRNYAYYPPLPRRAFSGTENRVWNEYRAEHRLRLVPHDSRGTLNEAATLWLSQRLSVVGGITRPEQWNSKLRFEQDTFQGETLYWWPGHPSYRARWIHHRWLH